MLKEDISYLLDYYPVMFLISNMDIKKIDKVLDTKIINIFKKHKRIDF